MEPQAHICKEKFGMIHDQPGVCKDKNGIVIWNGPGCKNIYGECPYFDAKEENMDQVEIRRILDRCLTVNGVLTEEDEKLHVILGIMTSAHQIDKRYKSEWNNNLEQIENLINNDETHWEIKSKKIVMLINKLKR